MDLKSSFMTFASSFTALFAIVDPLAVIPVYLGLTDRFSAKERSVVSLKACAIATVILSIFAVTGEGIFRLFGISIPAFRIAGGILLLLLGISQLEAHRERVKTEEENESFSREDISIFPLATPLLAGPGAISTVVLQSSQISGPLPTALFLASITCVFIASYFLLKSAPHLYRLLGRTGINLVTRIMGIILTAIAIQFIIDGILGVVAQVKTL
ncbi:MAG: MarC family protein [Pseudobdellovibrionaceae bacterium]|uniref:MarC family protein n=1 Tax=Oligoflexus sp. TaxID=1971216 RepID=UPI0027BFEA95|nr:MarC family protein [Oligoflexus sp.]MDQ3232243.1 MarC family protein [Pseudobdellovibrionaceae bacterium]HYX38234.1 MarC family protein [Oligoflexus sp.]